MLKQRIYILSIFVLIFVFAKEASADNAILPAVKRKIGISAALEIALANAPEYDSFLQNETIANLSNKNSWRSLLPTIDISATHQYGLLGGNDLSSTTQTIEPHAPLSNHLDLTITENFYNNGENYREAKVSDLSSEIAQLNLRKGKARILVDTTKAFCDFSEATSLLSLQKQQLDAIRVQFRSIQNRYHQGVSSSRDFLRIKTQLQQTEISLLTSEFRIGQAREALKSLIGSGEISILSQSI